MGRTEDIRARCEEYEAVICPDASWPRGATQEARDRAYLLARVGRLETVEKAAKEVTKYSVSLLSAIENTLALTAEGEELLLKVVKGLFEAVDALEDEE
jgi:hypothetical protein